MAKDDDFNINDFDFRLPSTESQILESVNRLKYSMESQIDEITELQAKSFKYTKTVDKKLSEENQKDRIQNKKHFHLSLFVSVFSVLIAIASLFVAIFK